MQKQPIREKIRETVSPRRYENKMHYTGREGKEISSPLFLFLSLCLPHTTIIKSKNPSQNVNSPLLNMTIQDRWSLHSLAVFLHICPYRN